MKNKVEKIKEFMNDQEKLKAFLNDEKFIEKVSKSEATVEIYRKELKKFDLEITEKEAEQIQETVNKIFETPTEKIKLEDDFLKEIAGGKPNASSQGLSPSATAGMSAGIAAAWLGSGIGCAVAASVYRKKGNKDKFHKCATAAFHILNAPLLPLEAGLAFTVASTGGGSSANEDLKALFTHPVEHYLGVDVKED